MSVPGKASFWQRVFTFGLSFLSKTCKKAKNNAKKMEQQTPVENEVKTIQTLK